MLDLIMLAVALGFFALSLGYTIESEAAPTRPQLAVYDVLNGKLQEQLKRLQEVLNADLPALNEPGSGPSAGKYKLAPIPGGKQVLGSWSWAIPTNSGASDGRFRHEPRR